MAGGAGAAQAGGARDPIAIVSVNRAARTTLFHRRNVPWSTGCVNDRAVGPWGRFCRCSFGCGRSMRAANDMESGAVGALPDVSDDADGDADDPEVACCPGGRARRSRGMAKYHPIGRSNLIRVHPSADHPRPVCHHHPTQPPGRPSAAAVGRYGRHPAPCPSG
jgi:hypothetical protein